MILGLGGCALQKTDGADRVIQKEEFQQRQNEMEQYFRKKYGDIEYEVTGVIWKFWNQPYDQMNLRIPTQKREETCWVRRYEKSGEIVFTDSYLGLCIRDEYETKMKETAQMVFSKVKVFSFTQECEFSQDAENSLERLQEKGEKIRAISWMFVREEENFPQKAKQFETLWAEENMESLIVVFLTREEVFQTIERDTADIIVKKGCYLDREVCSAGWEIRYDLP